MDSERNFNLAEANTAVVVGWGVTGYNNGGMGSDKLQKAYLKLVKQADCDALFRKLKSSTSIPLGIQSSMLCAKGNG